jgi:hypothetical protein
VANFLECLKVAAVTGSGKILGSASFPLSDLFDQIRMTALDVLQADWEISRFLSQVPYKKNQVCC